MAVRRAVASAPEEKGLALARQPARWLLQAGSLYREQQTWNSRLIVLLDPARRERTRVVSRHDAVDCEEAASGEQVLRRSNGARMRSCVSYEDCSSCSESLEAPPVTGCEKIKVERDEEVKCSFATDRIRAHSLSHHGLKVSLGRDEDSLNKAQHWCRLEIQRGECNAATRGVVVPTVHARVHQNLPSEGKERGTTTERFTPWS